MQIREKKYIFFMIFQQLLLIIKFSQKKNKQRNNSPLRIKILNKKNITQFQVHIIPLTSKKKIITSLFICINLPLKNKQTNNF